MRMFPVRSDVVSFAVTETGAQLSDVVFTLPDGRRIAPMHTAPWIDERFTPEIPPSLRVLRGDFLCAPFGASDVIPGEARGHGATANGDWRATRIGEGYVGAELAGDVMGSRVSALFETRPGERIIYQTHRFVGGRGRLPIGHHAMLRADPSLELGFGARIWAGTPPEPVERPPAGRSILTYPQTIEDLHAARLAEGGTADLTHYPFAAGHEDLLMLIADPAGILGWSAAVSPQSGWVWFALKDSRVLPQTVLWLSNGGRTYPPFSSRHTGVIGIEEVCSYFHLGHKASISPNPVSSRGVPTSIALDPDGEIVIRYAFGLAPVPPGFGAVVDIRPGAGGIVLSDAAGHETHAAVDLTHITGPRSPRVEK